MSSLLTLEVCKFRVSIRQSIQRDCGSAKNLLAATGMRQPKGLSSPMTSSRRGKRRRVTGNDRVAGRDLETPRRRLSLIARPAMRSRASRTGCQRLSSRRTPRNARFRRDIAVWHMTLWSQNSSVGPLSTLSGRSIRAEIKNSAACAFGRKSGTFERSRRT
jgi:hypothetical protein